MKIRNRSWKERSCALALAFSMVFGMVPQQEAVAQEPTVSVETLSTSTYSISFDSQAYTLLVGGTAAMSATLSNGTKVSSSDMTFSSGNSKVASVTSGGVLTGIAEGSVTITGTYTGSAAVSAKTITTTVTVSKLSDAENNAKITELYFTTDNNGSNSKSTSTILSTTGTKNDYLNVRLIASGGTENQNLTLASSSTELAKVNFSIAPNSGVAEMTQISTGTVGTRYLTASNSGQAIVTAYHDDNENGKWDSGEATGDFTVIVSGITVDTTGEAMLTHSESDTITVTKFGNASGITWTSRNSGLVTIETTSADNTTAILKTNDTTGTGIIDISSTEGSVSFSVTVSEAIASHIIPVDNINVLNVLKFSDLISDFVERSKEVYPDETLASLSSIEVTPSEGTLYLGYQSEDNTGAGLATNASYSISGTPSVSDIVFVPNGSYTGETAVIKYTGRTSEDRTFYGEIHVTLAPSDEVFSSTGTQEPVSLSTYAFSQWAAASGKAVDYVVFTLPDENRATMYYEYKSADNYHHRMTTGEQITLKDIDKVTVIPAPGFSGTLLIPYIITCTDETTLIGELNIEVEGYGPEGPIAYNTISGEYITLITDDFHRNVQAITGYSMNYVTFSLPNASEGTLYELYYSKDNYRQVVTENTAYFASSRSPQISEVSFVPATGFQGSCHIDFVGYDMLGNSYAGILEVNVGSQTVGDINYVCSAGSFVPFYEGDFNYYSRLSTGYNVDYITFPVVPSSLQGSLRLGQTSYHDGVAVSAGTEYSASGTYLMSKLTFEAAEGFSGIVSIPFEGMAVNGTAFAGVITVVVANQNLVKVPYSATYYSPATLNADHFEHYATERTGASLDYIRFELPNESVGVLYYNYTSEDDYGSLVTADLDYYVSKSHFLNSVTFVPNRDFQGTAQINFTGWGTNGQTFSGTITVSVADGGDPLSYYMYTGDYVYLNTNALNDFCIDETGSALNYITITTPSTEEGRLYQDYNSSDTAHTSAGTTTRFYKSQSPYITNLAFVSTVGYVGSVALPFTATAVDGSTCTGTINILVRPSEANASVYYYTSFAPIRLNQDDFEAVWGSEAIDYIEIHNTPTATQGKLYYENDLSSFATTSMKYYSKSNGAGPYISEMVFAPRAGFSGTMILTYTATTVAGRTFTGDVQVIVTTMQPSLYFSDMSNHLWATASADYLYITQVSSGVGNGKFDPNSSITRGDFALMLMMAFRFTGTTEDIFTDVDKGAYYYDAVHTLRALGITGGYSNNTFRPSETISRQDAMIMLRKSMDVASKGLVTASNSVLTQYKDSGSVALYASSDMATMVSAGMISGDTSGNLNPDKNMSRAEMAVVLHQAMTY